MQQGESERRLVVKLRRIMEEALVFDAPEGGRERSRAACLAREITRISNRYGWWEAVQAALDQVGARRLRDLDQHQLEALADQMRALVENAMTVCDLADDLPAR